MHSNARPKGKYCYHSRHGECISLIQVPVYGDYKPSCAKYDYKPLKEYKTVDNIIVGDTYTLYKKCKDCLKDRRG